MVRKYWLPILFTILAALAIIVGASLAFPRAAQGATQLQPALAPDESEAQQIAAGGVYVWSYAVKFVCGFQPPFTNDPAGTVWSGEPVVKPGNYATEINIHNPNYKLLPLRKKFILLVETKLDGTQVITREPQSAGPRAYMNMQLEADFATMDDCNNLFQIIYQQQPPPNTPMPLMVGYLVVLTPLNIDIDVVYTASAPGDVTTPATGISIDVERVPGTRVYLPNGALPPPTP